MKHLFDKLAHVLNRTAYRAMFPKSEDTFESCLKKSFQKQAVYVGIAIFLGIVFAFLWLGEFAAVNYWIENVHLMENQGFAFWGWIVLEVVSLLVPCIPLVLFVSWVEQRADKPFLWAKTLVNIVYEKAVIFVVIAAPMLASVEEAVIRAAMGYDKEDAVAVFIAMLLVIVQIPIVYYFLSMHIARHYVD